MRINKGRLFPIIMTVLFIVIIIYLFATAKQSLVVCDKKVTDNLGISVSEKLEATIDGKNIKNIILTKTIILPEEYLKNDTYVDYILFTLENSYRYLGDKAVVNKVDNRVISQVIINDDETVILNNIKFLYNDKLQMKINSNTKSSDVITLRVKDNYTDGELMTRLKNNGYSCK